MASTSLFAPQVPTIQPAFVYDIVKNEGIVDITFKLSFLNEDQDFSGCLVTLKDIKGDLVGRYLKKKDEIHFNNREENYLLQLQLTRLKINTYYQLQLSLITTNLNLNGLEDESITEAWLERNKDNLSEISQVSLIRPISKIKQTYIKNLNNESFNGQIIEGWIEYEDGSTLEYIENYTIEIIKNGIVDYQSDIIDNFLGTSFSLKTNYYISPFTDVLSKDDSYKIIINFTTINGYKSSFEKTLTVPASQDIVVEAKNWLFFSNSEKEGAVKVSLTPDFAILTNNIPFQSKEGYLEVFRASEDNQFKNWKKIAHIDTPQEVWNIYSTVSFLDCYCNFGEIYHYLIRYVNYESNTTFLFCEKKITDSYYLPYKKSIDYNDIYLSDKNYLLHMNLNPSISGLKYVTQENISNTLGSKYPIFRRNGHTKYKQFNLSGLLYFEMESINNDYDSTTRSLRMRDFLESNTVGFYYGYQEALKNLQNRNYYDSISLPRTEEITSIRENPFIPQGQKVLNYMDYGRQKHIFNKRLRDLVIEFLTNGKPKLFRTFEEGSMIVFLSDISFTPNNQLGRAVYEFSATVTEFCEATEENVLKYGLAIDNTLNINNLIVLRATSKQDANISDGSVIFTPFIGVGEGASGNIEGNLLKLYSTKRSKDQ